MVKGWGHSGQGVLTRGPDGRFRDGAQRPRVVAEYEAWLDKKPGRRRGVERALTAERDGLGQIAPGLASSHVIRSC